MTSQNSNPPFGRSQSRSADHPVHEATAGDDTYLQLQESQQFLHAILESIEDGIVACDCDGRLTLFNQATRNFYTLPDAMLSPEAWASHFDLYLPDGQTTMPLKGNPLYRALQGEQVENAELVVGPKAGPQRRLLAKGQPMLAPDGEKLGAVISLHDVTKIKETEVALEKSALRYWNLYDDTPVMLHSLDHERRITNVNRHWLAVLGYDRDEVVGREFASFLRSGNMETGTEEDSNPSGMIGDIEDTHCKLLTKSGAEIDVNISSRPEIGDHGQVTGTLCVISDVTAQKRAEKARRLSEDRFGSAFETAPHGMALVALHNTWIAVNPAICELFGYSEEELMVQGWRALDGSDELSISEEALQKLLSGDVRSHQLERQFFHKDGHRVSVLLSVSLVRNTDGGLANFVLQFFDLTELKETEEKLRQSQKLEAVGMLTGGLAHDFNNLLAIVMGNLELLSRHVSDDEKAVKRLCAALDATDRGAELTNRLLAFSRRQTLEPKTIDPNELIHGMQRLLARALGEATTLDLQTSNDLWPATVDPSQLEASLLNLAINARDAMPDGGKLTISTNNVELSDPDCASHTDIRPGDYLHIAISDTGVGIPKDMLDQVFQPFFTTKEIGKGSGLGLSMVYGFVKQSGGHIDIKSEESRGTTIEIYLPRSTESQTTTTLLAPHQFDQAGGTEVILVVEDDNAVREVAVFLLAELGYKVFEAGDGPSAIALLGELPQIDLLFSDIVMPGRMKGQELAARVREIYPSVKVLHCSGYPQTTTLGNDLENSSTGYLPKPYRADTLARKVRQLLDG